MSTTQNSPSHVSILGHGWLGQALFEKLKSDGVKVKSFSRSTQNSEHRVKFELGKDELNISELGQTLVITLTPRDVMDCYGAFKSFVKNLPPEKHLIYISSTSVFGTAQGLCTEKVSPVPDSDRGKRQKELEDFVTKSHEMTTVVRAGGLIGDDRFPSFTSDHKFSAYDMVNLIDKEDVVNILSQVISEKIKPSLVHAVAPFHPLKRDYYLSERSEAKASPTPHGKMIFSDYLTQSNYSFINPSLKHPKAANGGNTK